MRLVDALRCVQYICWHSELHFELRIAGCGGADQENGGESSMEVSNEYKEVAAFLTDSLAAIVPGH